MSENDDRLAEDELKRYVEDIRMIKRTLEVADGSFRIFSWFYYAVAGLVIVGTGVNVLLARATGMVMRESLVFVWIPVFILAGATEMVAWTMKSARQNVPILTPGFTRYLVAGSTMVIGLATLAVVLLHHGLLTPGVVLILVGTVLCITVQYVHFWFLLEAFGLVFIGLLFVLIGARGEAYFIVDGVIFAGVMALAGVIEGILTRQNRRG